MSMKLLNRHQRIALPVALASVVFWQTWAVAQGPFVLHDGTPVRLRLNRNLSSGDSRTGDTVDFEVLDDVKVNDVVVIARGATALGTITGAKQKGRMAKGGKLDVTIDHVRLVDDEKVALRAVKEVQGGGHTGAMTGGIVATAIVLWPAAPFFLFMHGKDVTIPKGTEIAAYVNGEIGLNPAKFPGASQVVSRAVPLEVQVVPVPVATTAPPLRTVTAVATQRAPVAATEVTQAALVEPEAKPELTVTSDPTGAAVEINGVSVGTTPVTVALAKGTNCTLSVKKDGFLPWITHYSATLPGKFTMNANLTREVFR